MANIKFSDFTVGNTEGDIDFVVGYKGANNIQISPTNLLAASLSGYLPLTGGTMTGDVIFNDNIIAKFGNNADLTILHDSNHSYIKNYTGDLYVENFADDSDIIFKSDDGSGGVTNYIQIDGSELRTTFNKTIRLNDAIAAQFGGSNGMQIYHNNSNSVIQNITGNLTIRNDANDKDIEFACDDGSGGVTPYFRLDGSQVETVVFKDFNFEDSVNAKFGSSADLQIYHNATNSLIENSTGDFYISNKHDDGDIIFFCDDGSGGTTEYFKLDGGDTITRVARNFRANDNVALQVGVDGDAGMYHDGTNTYIQNDTGDLIIRNNANDKDILFQSDNGGGGVITYFLLDGSLAAGSVPVTRFPDNSKLGFGDSTDLQIYHDGNNSSYITSTTSDIYLRNEGNNDKTYIQATNNNTIHNHIIIDGSAGETIFSRNTQHLDQVHAQFGTGNDLKIYHSGTASVIDNTTGHLYIKSTQTDGDIIFEADNSAGSVTEYFRLDGGDTRIKIPDNIIMTFGNGGDLQLSHSATDSLIRNYTGNLTITNFAGDKDIIFKADDGSGGTAQYFRLDGGSVTNQFLKTVKLYDNVPLWIGDNNDLQIYHDGSDSYIKDAGTGDLKILGADIEISTAGGNKYFSGAANVAKLYHTNNEKLATTNTGIKISGVSEYADNTAAIAGGLTAGDVYRTGDLLKIVH